VVRGIRRKERAVTDPKEIRAVLREAEYVTVAMCADGEPYLATISHGYDEERGCIYFHCAREGKKVEILRANSLVWGQALIDGGYQQGKCAHFYRTTQFRGRVTFIEDLQEKKHALELMIKKLDSDPAMVIKEQLTPDSVQKVLIGRIDIDFMSGKRADEIT
jgi:nitroimidazol reductase NimA-like FMN-containing flavoprotein (pyridoxamine 5'-phosphate oxidase superfamily)